MTRLARFVARNVNFGADAGRSFLKRESHVVAQIRSALAALPLVFPSKSFSDFVMRASAFAIFATSLNLLVGYAGMVSFGHGLFFGLGAYTYAIAMFNIGESTLPLLLAIILPAAFAALLGYFMFYGRISDVYLCVITLTVTLILFNSVNSTAGPEFHIGAARLGGFNGIPGIPPLNWPFDKATTIDLEGMFYLATGSLLLPGVFPLEPIRSSAMPVHRTQWI